MSCCNAPRPYLANNLPRFLMRALLFVPIAIATPSHAQTTPSPSFEVATVKPIDAKNPHPPSVLISGDRFAATGLTLQELIKIAYDMNYGADRQVSGGPAWVGSARFDIEAKEDAALAEKLKKLLSEQRGVQLRQMLQALLAERFKLQIHHESSELPVYQLVLAKSGSKLMPSVAQLSTNQEDPRDKPRTAVRFAGKGVLEGSDADAQTLVTALSMQPEVGGRLVVDKTGLTGKYDFTLKWTPDTTQAADSNGTDTGPSLFTALQEQLGLRLESTKAPVDIIVIDHVELPSAN
jgi:uncharacterized protein (TIGR03435 family)